MTITEDRSPQADSASAVEARPVAGFIGAEVSGVDLGSELSVAEVADIRAALLRHRVIFFRDQHISPEQHIAFGRRFADVTPAHPTLPSLDGYPEILELGGSLYTGEDESDAQGDGLAAFLENLSLIHI